MAHEALAHKLPGAARARGEGPEGLDALSRNRPCATCGPQIRSAGRSRPRSSRARANCRSRLELIELAPGSGLWPCEMAGASAVTLKQPSALGAIGGAAARRIR